MDKNEHTEIIELIPAYALGSLDAAEAVTVSQHLAGCAECQAELAAYEAVVDTLPAAAPVLAPSPALKKRLLAQVQSKREGKTAVSPQPTFWQRISHALRQPRWQTAVALAALILIIGGLFLWQQTNQSAPTEIVLTGTEAAPEAQGVIQVAGNGREGILTVSGLPPLSPEQQYQLWLIDDGQRVSGGLFSVSADGRTTLTIHAPQPLTEFSAFGVTIEPAGGSPGPTGQRVLGFNL
ncbi:MAG TPA: hypothetical protein EYP41_01145 [Anaerolineae bacterium]|nr:hypothetical protein [Anaerolineae bacterium]